MLNKRSTAAYDGRATFYSQLKHNLPPHSIATVALNNKNNAALTAVDTVVHLE
jgi:hypothetical protein